MPSVNHLKEVGNESGKSLHFLRFQTKPSRSLNISYPLSVAILWLSSLCRSVKICLVRDMTKTLENICQFLCYRVCHADAIGYEVFGAKTTRIAAGVSG